jgi:hypothetical protein
MQAEVATMPTAGLAPWLAQARNRLPLLWWAGCAALAVSVLLLVPMALDERSFQGVNVWVKPWKFHVSVAVHWLTLALFAALLADTAARRKRHGRMAVLLLAAGLMELAYIAWRASRGEASHFNVGDPVAAVMYALMGIGACVLTGCAIWLGWQLARATDFAGGRVLRHGLALGLVLGGVLGTVTGAWISVHGGHAVGAAAGTTPGLPVLGWGMTAGDLRVAHFFGLHAMQVLPLLAWGLQRRLAVPWALAGLYAAAVLYTGFTLFTLAQALAGHPLF